MFITISLAVIVFILFTLVTLSPFMLPLAVMFPETVKPVKVPTDVIAVCAACVTVSALQM